VTGHRAFLLTPKSERGHNESAWVWYAPTLLEKDTPSAVNQYLFDELIKHGIRVAGVDIGESYGSPEGGEVYSAFYKVIVENHRLSTKPCLFAQSRGGLMFYNWAESHADAVRCIGGIYPVTDLTSWPLQKDSPEQFEEARKAYVTKDDEEFRRHLEDFSPISHLASLAERNVPILHLHGSCDC
jgi:hypothetical protein